MTEVAAEVGSTEELEGFGYALVGEEVVAGIWFLSAFLESI